MIMSVGYAAITSAVQHATAFFNAYLKGSGSRTNCVSLGGIENGQNEDFLQAYRKECSQKGMLESKDVCGSIIYLLSEFPHYVVGQNIEVDDGISV